MDLAAEIKIIAFSEVQKNTAEYRLRSVYRWYSRAFATPLHMVPSLPFTDVLTAYFEDQFENMDAEDLEAERKLLTETVDQKAARIAEEEAVANAEVEFQAFAASEAKRLESTQIQKQEPVRPIQHPHRQAKEAELPEVKEIPPDITVKFVDEGFFEDLMDKIDGE